LEMDPHTSLGRMSINENQNVTLNDMIESEGEWSGSDYLDTTDNGKKKETKAYTFYRMESEEYEKNLLSNEFLVKLGLTYEVMKNEDKVVDRKLLVSLKGKLYFIDFIVIPKEDDVEPCVIFG
ncbi:hypothetical protein Tco_1574032, partial [Tanacetum coccineum]